MMINKTTREILERLARVEAAISAFGTPPRDGADQKLDTAAVADRYNKDIRTVNRWTQDPALGFPKPTYIRGRKFWNLSELKEWDRAQVFLVTRGRDPRVRKERAEHEILETA